ncbi:MMPL family transporter [Agreia bicolorata]|uniref:Membrane protein n=1 Tax=Agreia bicolorata TaxID=110935 RepID=A0ABR5CEN9_9MICO|nr:MMPL family transporter [Agreia bicolorata]KJC64092.1 membrane protein [Agreia bicolorata]
MRVPRWLRILLPAALILVWLTAASIGGPYFGRIDEVSSNDQTSYLPASADATRVSALQKQFTDSDAIPAIVVFRTDDGAELTDEQRADIQKQINGLSSVVGVADGISPAIPSQDEQAVEVFVPIDASGEVRDTVDSMRSFLLREGSIDGVTAFVTGPAGFTADIGDAFAGIDGILLLTALGAVFVILFIVYRSPLLPFLVLGTSLFALTTSLLTVWWLAKAGVFTLNGQVQGILFILVIGAATDYSLLYVSRYKEALRTHEKRWEATWAALRVSLEPIVASGGTVIAGLLCLLFSDLNSNKALGPVSAVGVAFSVLASLTLLPALLLACGRASFWPLRPTYMAPDGAAVRVDAEPARHGFAAHKTVHGAPKGFWPKLESFIAWRPRAIWIVTTVVLLAAGTGVLQLQANGVPQSDLILGQSEARDGQVALGEHFPGGSGSPALIVAPEADLGDVASTILSTDGVTSLTVTSANSPSGSANVDSDGVLSAPGGAQTLVAVEPTVVDGDVLLQATLSDAADSDAAKDTVRALRSALADGSSGALVGGVTATAIDSDTAGLHDRNTIIPIVLVVILLILMLLLRSILAPVLLILSVVVSFAAALGVSALVFNHLFQFPGADPSVPLYGFVFLVALGIDYNIFLMTRVREESIAHGTRAGILRGLTVTGGVITSAGIVLAATFSALGVIPVLFLAQIAFIVAFGVLLDTLLVRSLLVPALAYDLGRVVWWPSKLAKAPEGVETTSR